MRTKYLPIVLCLILFFKNSQGQTLIAGWDFQTTANGGTAVAASPNTPTSFIANIGTGTLYLDGTNGSSTWSTSTELSAFTGTTVNTAGSTLSTTTTSPACLALLGGTSNAANGKSIVFKFSMLNYTYFKITYATQRSGTGFNTQTWAYSTDNGTTWTDFQTITGTSIPSSFATVAVLPNSDGSGLGGVSNALIKVTFTGATASSGNNRIDNIQIIGSATALPVSLTKLSSEKFGKANNIYWQTASEQNNSGFDIQRSNDGVNFEKIGFVKSLSTSGNSSSRLDYSFTDYNPVGLKQYYRLKQIDIDGAYKYSAIVLVTREAPTSFELTRVYPNPTQESVYINAAAHKNMELQLFIYDLSGRVVGRKQVVVQIGNNGFDMPVAHLAPGTYLIKVVNSEQEVVATQKFIKQ